MGEVSQTARLKPKYIFISVMKMRHPRRIPRRLTMPAVRYIILRSRRELLRTADSIACTRSIFRSARSGFIFEWRCRVQWLTEPHAPAVNASSGYSFAVWIKPSSLDGAIIQSDSLRVLLEGGLIRVQSGGVEPGIQHGADRGQMASHRFDDMRMRYACIWMARRRVKPGMRYCLQAA